MSNYFDKLYDKLYEKLETGDIILFHGTSKVSCCIEFWTCSKYSHIGMILKDPIYIDSKLTGLYLWQSGREGFPEAEDNMNIYGVQISSLKKVLKECSLKNVYVRKLFSKLPLNRDPLMINKLKLIHQEIHHHDYDLNPLDWLLAGEYQLDTWINLPENEKKYLLHQQPKGIPSSVWCSALIGFIYYNLGLIKNPNWKLLSPQDWSYKNNKLLMFNNCSLYKDTPIKKI